MELDQYLQDITDYTHVWLAAVEQQQSFALNLANKRKVNPFDQLRDSTYLTLAQSMIAASNAGYKEQAYTCHKLARNAFYADKEV